MEMETARSPAGMVAPDMVSALPGPPAAPAPCAPTRTTPGSTRTVIGKGSASFAGAGFAAGAGEAALAIPTAKIILAPALTTILGLERIIAPPTPPAEYGPAPPVFPTRPPAGAHRGH